MAKVAASAHIIREYQTDAIEGEITDLTGTASRPGQFVRWERTGCLGMQSYQNCPCNDCTRMREQDAQWEADRAAFEAEDRAWEQGTCSGCSNKRIDCMCYCEGCNRTGQSRCKC
jgi:hypothetical protein